MRRSTFFLVWALLAALSYPVCAAEPAYRLSVVTDRPDALYSVGQQAKFLIKLNQGGQPANGAEVVCVLNTDGMPPITRKSLKLENATATIEGSLAEPGFLRCWVSFNPPGEKKQPITAMAGAGFDPLKIPPSLPVPEDFDAFWTAQKAKLATVPMKPVLTSVKSPAEGIECFDVQIPCVPPRPVSGYFARPAGAAAKSLPAILYVHGAGVRSSSLGAAAHSARRFNALAMDINAHGIPNGKPEAFYKEMSEGELKGYPQAGREDREKCYFLGMFLRLTRAMEFLTSQPEWDGRTLIVRGSSQGGGQAIAAAGLDPRVTFISAGVPAICDHSGKAVGRASGWPQLVPDQGGKPDPKVLQVARYFDGMNFATRAKADAIFSVGFIDTTCPATSVYAAFNNLPGKKRMVIEPLMGHAISPKFEQASDAAIIQHIARRGMPSRTSLRPFWHSTTMEGESVLFIKDGAEGQPKACLVFEPRQVLSVRSSSGAVAYVEGRDYLWKPGAKEVLLPPGSRIPFKTPQDLRRPPKSQPYALTHRDGKGEILFGGGHEYHDMQTVISYTHRPNAWTGPAPSFAGERLPRTLKKLTGKQPLSIALLGDSISTGCNASGWAKVAPFQPPYQDLLVLNLETAYGAPVTLTNFAVGGTDTAWGLANIGKVIEARPDLVILAFGMNDSAGRPAAEYQANIRKMIEAVRKARPEAEFILIATMLGNKDWIALRQELFPQYRDALAALCGPGIALANMTSIWAELLKHKKDWDLTGNGVNHPNDFGHRVYAQVLSVLLIRDEPRE